MSSPLAVMKFQSFRNSGRTENALGTDGHNLADETDRRRLVRGWFLIGLDIQVQLRSHRDCVAARPVGSPVANTCQAATGWDRARPGDQGSRSNGAKFILGERTQDALQGLRLWAKRGGGKSLPPHNVLGSADPCVCRNDILLRLADVGPTL